MDYAVYSRSLCSAADSAPASDDGYCLRYSAAPGRFRLRPEQERIPHSEVHDIWKRSGNDLTHLAGEMQSCRRLTDPSDDLHQMATEALKTGDLTAAQAWVDAVQESGLNAHSYLFPKRHAQIRWHSLGLNGDQVEAETVRLLNKRSPGWTDESEIPGIEDHWQELATAPLSVTKTGRVSTRKVRQRRPQ